MKAPNHQKLDHFRRVCKAHKLSMTPQRMAIFKAVLSCDNHPHTEDVFNLVRASFPDISMDTVYRTLSTFSGLGLVHLVEGCGQPRRYDPITEPHHHFRCKQCGTIVDFYDEALNAIQTPTIIQDKYTVTGVKVTLEGLCDQCGQGASPEGSGRSKNS